MSIRPPSSLASVSHIKHSSDTISSSTSSSSKTHKKRRITPLPSSHLTAITSNRFASSHTPAYLLPENNNFPTLYELCLHRSQWGENQYIMAHAAKHLIELADQYPLVRMFTNSHLGKSYTQPLNEADVPLIMHTGLPNLLQGFLGLYLDVLNPQSLTELEESGHNIPRLLLNKINEEENKIRNRELERIWRRVIHKQLSRLTFSSSLPGKHANAKEIEDWFETKPDLSSIEELNLDLLSLKFFPKIIRHFTNLQLLKIDHNDIRIILDSPFYLPKLVNLDLHSNKMMHLHEDFLKGFPKLEILDLGKNQIKDLQKTVFDKNPNLRVICLNKNKIEKIDKDLFNKNHNLEELYLFDNFQLIELSPSIFRETKIRYIGLQDTQITQHQVNKLFKELPTLNNVGLNDTKTVSFQDNFCIYL